MNDVAADDKRLTEERARGLLEQVQHARIVDDQSFRDVAMLLVRAKAYATLLEQKFQPSIAAAHKAHKEAIKIRNEVMVGFEEAETLAKDKIGMYVETLEEAPKVDGVTFAEVWTAEVIDAYLVPREYMTPDLEKIRAVAKGLREQCRIPGVRAYKTRQVRVVS